MNVTVGGVGWGRAMNVGGGGDRSMYIILFYFYGGLGLDFLAKVVYGADNNL